MSAVVKVCFDVEISDGAMGGTQYDALITALSTVQSALNNPAPHLKPATIRDYDGYCELFSSMCFTHNGHTWTESGRGLVLKDKELRDAEDGSI